MLNKVKLSLTVCTARFALKALNLQEFVCAFCRHVVLVMPYTLLCSGWACGWRGIRAIFLEESRANFSYGSTHLVCLQLCLSATYRIYSVPCISPLLSPLDPSFSSWGFTFLLTTATVALLLHCLPLPCAHLVSFSCIFQKFPHSYSKQIGQSPPSSPVCYFVGLRSELCSLEGYPIALTPLFLAFPTVLEHGRGCWTYSLPVFTVKYFLLFLLLRFL